MINKSEWLFKGKLKQVTKPWQKYLEGKVLLLFKFNEEAFNLILAHDEEGNTIENLCKYIFENDRETYDKLGYESLNAWMEECKLGNDGFGFTKDEIEILED